MSVSCIVTLVLLFASIGSVHGDQQRGFQQHDLQLLAETWHAGDASDLPAKCLFPAVAHALENRAHLDLPAQQALNAVLARPNAHKSRVIGSFRFHYDTTGRHTPAMVNSQGERIPGTAEQYIDSAGAILDYVLRYQTESMGYLPPPSDNGAGGGPEYDVYVQSLGGTSYGFTTPETPLNQKPAGGTFTSYMTIDADFAFVSPTENKGLPALRVTLAHELFHATQLGNYGYWGSDIYYYEICAVWMEDVIYTDVNDYYQYLRSISGHFSHPEFSFVSNSFIMYSRGLWCHYLAKRFGRDVIRESWENIREGRPLTALQRALEDPRYGSSLRLAFTEWTLWNYFTGSRADSIRYYPEGRNYPLIMENRVDFSASSRVVAGSAYPLGAVYYDVAGNNQQVKLVVLNLDTLNAVNDPQHARSYSLFLNTKKVEPDYISTAGQVFVKLQVPDPTNWFVKDVFGTSGVEQPFPNPFVADGKRLLQFPVPSNSEILGTLSVFSSSMDLMYSQEQTSVFLPTLGKHVLRWDGRNERNQVVASGVYFYVLSYHSQTVTGKVAVLRK